MFDRGSGMRPGLNHP